MVTESFGSALEPPNDCIDALVVTGGKSQP